MVQPNGSATQQVEPLWYVHGHPLLSIDVSDTVTAHFHFFCVRAYSARKEVLLHVTVLDFRPLQGFRRSAQGVPQEKSPYIMLRGLENLFPGIQFLFMDGLDYERLWGVLRIGAEPDPGLAKYQPNEDRLDLLILPSALPVRPAKFAKPVLVTCRRSDVMSQYPFPWTDENPIYPPAWRNALYLDISFLPGRSLPYLTQLRVLKLRGMRLDSSVLRPFLQFLGRRIWSLDIRDNRLGDETIHVIVTNNVLMKLPNHRAEYIYERVPTRPGYRPESTSEGSPKLQSPRLRPGTALMRFMDEPPAYVEEVDTTEPETRFADDIKTVRADDADGFMKHLEQNQQIHIIREHGLPVSTDDTMITTGLTQLYVSGNPMRSDAIRTLLDSSNRFQVLDIGGVDETVNPLAAEHPNLRPVCIPHAVSSLILRNARRLHSLRIHHSIVTHTPTLRTIGEFHLSERRHIEISENEFAPIEMKEWPGQFTPTLNNRLHSLTLTNLPRKSGGLLIERLKTFLHELSLQEGMIEEFSKGVFCQTNARRGPVLFTGVRVLTLEFEPVDMHLAVSVSGLSVSEDVDADNFVAESNRDFSFFDDNGGGSDDFSFFGSEESTAPREHRSTPESASVQKGLSFNLEQISISSESKGKGKEKEPLKDVLEELQQYRAETMERYEREYRKSELMRARSGGDPKRVPLGEPHCFWTGELVITSYAAEE
jgi:hypothetical protein